MKTPDLPKGKRIKAAQLSGTMGAMPGRFRNLSREEKLAEIRAVTSDPEILGHQLGLHLVDDGPFDVAAAEMLRELGADEAVAERRAEWLRWRRARDASAEGPVL